MTKKPKISCPVPNCLEMIDFRATYCKPHSLMKRHNPTFTNDQLSSHTVYLNTMVCKTVGCNRSVAKAGRTCYRCAQILRREPNLTDQELVNWETRAQRMVKNKEIIVERESKGLKVCPWCEVEKPLLDFSSCKSNKDGLMCHCKECRLEQQRDRDRHKRATDPGYRLRKNMSRSIQLALKANGSSKRGESFLAHLDYNISELQIHLEKQFSSEMTWDNYGILWCVDHLIPQALFNYSSLDDPKFQICWSLNNLRPLLITENNKKSSFYEGRLWRRGEGL